MKNKLLLSILTLGIISCKENTSKIVDLTNLKSIEGFVDIPLSIVGTEEIDNYYIYNTSATFNNDTLGIIIKLKKEIPAGFINGEAVNLFVDEGIELSSKGNESDNLLRFISEKYNLGDKTIFIKDSQIFTCANLNQEKVNYKKGESRFKIFFEGDEDESYAELFINFNFSKGIISLNEKDQEYRESLVKLMSKE